MNIPSINSPLQNSSEQPESSGPLENNKLGQQEFLQLLIAQMQHQDPINPVEGAEFASQLAQFNSVEQLISVNNGLKELQNSQQEMSTSLTNSMAASLAGKQVKALSDRIYLEPGESTQVNYKLDSSASQVEMIVRNSGGSEVRRDVLEAVGSGENTWEWDGRNNAGDSLPEGGYTVDVRAGNDASPVDSLVFIEGVARKVRYTGQGIYLSVGQIDVPIGDVEEVGEKE